ncbi:MAG: Stf0 family sulfotransferase [Pseudomonadota bacterium]
MNAEKKKAIVILSEGRSGTTYLASRINGVGTMGKIDEWFDLYPAATGTPAEVFEDLYSQVIAAGSTANGQLGLKLFPRHLYAIQSFYGVDLLARLAEDYELLLLFIERRDRALQAISFSRAMQSGQWTSAATRMAAKPVTYDFAQLCRLYFLIGESYDFWRSYLAAKQLDHLHAYYEDMLTSDDVLRACAAFSGEPVDVFPAAETAVQRTESSHALKERFLAELANSNIMAHHAKVQMPERSVKNVLRLALGRRVKPLPFSY